MFFYTFIKNIKNVFDIYMYGLLHNLTTAYQKIILDKSKYFRPKFLMCMYLNILRCR